MTNAPSPSLKYHRWTIGDRLAVARKTITPSQDRFAEMIGMSGVTVGRYETGPDQMTRKPVYMKLWAAATGFDVEWLMTGVEPNESAGPPSGNDGEVIDFRTGEKPATKGRRSTARYGKTPHQRPRVLEPAAIAA